MSTLVLAFCAASCFLSGCLGMLFYFRSRRDYRGPTRPALWLTPFALWAPANYTGKGPLYIRRSLLCFIIFGACVLLFLIAGQLSTGG